MTGLCAYLRTLDVPTLATMLAEQAERDPVLRAELERRAAGADIDTTDTTDTTGITDTAAVPEPRPGPVMPSCLGKVGPVLDTVARLLDSGSSANVAPLARRAVEQLRREPAPAAAVRAELTRAVRLYARACAVRPPEPEQLADWLVRLWLERPGMLSVELAGFAGALGEAGLHRVGAALDEAPERTGPGAVVAGEVREQLAEITGDTDGLLKILTAKPACPQTSRRIVRVLRSAGRHTEAIAYAAKALGPEPERPEENIGARHTEFRRKPGRATFEALRTAATAAGTWALYRKPALDLLRERAERGEAAADLLVRALLAEDQPDRAWQAVLRYPASSELRLELAAQRESSHPAEVIPLYQEQVAELIARRDAEGYREAALRLRTVRTLHKRAGSTAEYERYLAELVDTHRRKTRLLAEIRGARIALPRL